MIHLTLTGYYAGQTICGAPREEGGHYAHAVHAPLHQKAYRGRCCKACLREVALSYEEGDEIPDWCQEIRNAEGE